MGFPALTKFGWQSHPLNCQRTKNNYHFGGTLRKNIVREIITPDAARRPDADESDLDDLAPKQL
jgi:hypothetical protein